MLDTLRNFFRAPILSLNTTSQVLLSTQKLRLYSVTRAQRVFLRRSQNEGSKSPARNRPLFFPEYYSVTISSRLASGSGNQCLSAHVDLPSGFSNTETQNISGHAKMQGGGMLPPQV